VLRLLRTRRGKRVPSPCLRGDHLVAQPRSMVRDGCPIQARFWLEWDTTAPGTAAFSTATDPRSSTPCTVRGRGPRNPTSGRKLFLISRPLKPSGSPYKFCDRGNSRALPASAGIDGARKAASSAGDSVLGSICVGAKGRFRWSRAQVGRCSHHIHRRAEA
jgi:hypothetical protein